MVVGGDVLNRGLLSVEGGQLSFIVVKLYLLTKLRNETILICGIPKEFIN